jgi:hypothetical protein
MTGKLANDNEHHIKPSSEKPTLDTSQWPLLLKVFIDFSTADMDQDQSVLIDRFFAFSP